VSLIGDAEAWTEEHRRCGDIDNRSPADASRILVCSCGAVLNRSTDERSDRR
jgi:hypothetical protein